jgi:hypothetical protein
MAKGLEALSANFIPVVVDASLSFRFSKDQLLK